MGIPEEEARHFDTGFRSGGVLVTVNAGDRVMDGTVKSITQDAVVFSQNVNDPLSLVKQREVRKTIRPETR